jgi:Raf kinase inhibitor-like YbhB/YbcL family protein
MIEIVMAAAFTLSSPAFENNTNIPSKFTCDAGMQNPSPALSWKDAPAGTKSFALIMHDPDAPLAGGFTHWVLFDIPAATTSLPEGFQPGSVGISGNSGFRRAGYGGPCPRRPVPAVGCASLSLHAVSARCPHARSAGRRNEGGCGEGDAGTRSRDGRTRWPLSEAGEAVVLRLR